MISTDDRAMLTSFFAAQQAMDLGGVLGCWCDDGVMRTPYAPAPLAREHRGVDALRKMFSALFSGSESIEVSDLALIRTDEPELWLANWSFVIRIRSGAVFSGNDIGTFRVRGGRIAEYCEYFDAIECARSYGLPLL